VAEDLVLERRERLVGAGVTLPAAAARELPIDPAGFVELGRNHVQASDAGDALRQLDVGAAPGHVVATVIRPRSPALATISASSPSCRALSTTCGKLAR